MKHYDLSEEKNHLIFDFRLIKEELIRIISFTLIIHFYMCIIKVTRINTEIVKKLVSIKIVLCIIYLFTNSFLPYNK